MPPVPSVLRVLRDSLSGFLCVGFFTRVSGDRQLPLAKVGVFVQHTFMFPCVCSYPWAHVKTPAVQRTAAAGTHMHQTSHGSALFSKRAAVTFAVPVKGGADSPRTEESIAGRALRFDAAVAAPHTGVS